jgi:hypothetical protein
VCDDPALPPALTGIKAGMTALETGIAGGLLGSGPAESVAGGAVMGGTQGRRADTLAAVLTRELGAGREG